MALNHAVLHNPHLAGESFCWDGGAVGVLLCHGYTATTAEVRPLAQALHRQGYTVAGPLLPGHGTSPDEMNRCRWSDWAAAVDRLYCSLAARCERVFVGGESMGALLALYTASRRPEVAGILSYAPAIRVHRKTLWLAYLAAPFVRVVAKRALGASETWQGYWVNPVPALLQMHRLQRAVIRRLPQIEQPLLVVQGRLDTDIDLAGVDLLYRKIGSPVKELHWMEESIHVVILDKELGQVAAKTIQFIERVLAAEEGQ